MWRFVLVESAERPIRFPLKFVRREHRPWQSDGLSSIPVLAKESPWLSVLLESLPMHAKVRADPLRSGKIPTEWPRLTEPLRIIVGNWLILCGYRDF